MTESGDNRPRLQNDLGGHEYTDDEKQLIHAIYTVLKNRDDDVNDMAKIIAGTAPHPKDYVFLYTKSAGFVYELAKNLLAYPLPKKMQPKTILDWLEIVTGHPFGGRVQKRHPSAIVSDEEFRALTADFTETGFAVDSVRQAIADGILDGETGEPLTEPPSLPLKNIRVSLMLDGKEVAHSGPGLSIENMDPEKAKAILIRICDQFPGIRDDRAEDCASIVQELGILLRSAL